MPADLPVAAPDHAERDPFADDVLERLLRSDVQYQQTHGHYIVPLSGRLLAARSERAALLVERQQDKERIERLETALSVYADPRHWAISRDDLAMRVVSWIDRLLCRVFGHCYDAYRIPIRCKCCGQRWRARGSHD